MNVRTSVMAAAAVALCLTATACGPSDGKGGGDGASGSASASATADGAAEASPSVGATAAGATAGSGAGAGPGPAPTTHGRTLTEAQLAEVALGAAELPGYEVTPMRGSDERGTEQSENDACRPLAAIINGSPEPAPAATVFRTVMDKREEGKDDQTVVTEILTSHPKGEAEQLLSSVRDAVRACEGGFRTTSDDGPSTYAEVKELPAPGAGQESFAYQVTGSVEGDRVPLVFHLVRTGETVVTFYAANFLGAQPPEVPAELVTAQAAKIP